jgi:hypothetical protein
MAKTPPKDESTTKGQRVDTGDTDMTDQEVAKAVGAKPKPPSKIGRSPQELRAGEDQSYDSPPDPEELPVAPEAAGAVGYAGSSQAEFNEPYIDGGALYSKPVR